VVGVARPARVPESRPNHRRILGLPRRPRGPGNNGRSNLWPLVWENPGNLAHATGVVRPLLYTPSSPSWPHYDEQLPMEELQVYSIGPHQYALPVNIPEGAAPQFSYLPNGYSHTLHADMSLGTYQHFKMMQNEVVTIGWASPQRVD
jgi:hypothetical protein